MTKLLYSEDLAHSKISWKLIKLQQLIVGNKSLIQLAAYIYAFMYPYDRVKYMHHALFHGDQF